ncbi:hypothetical protein [[Flexibacter] sp. ATCC 35208]|uniref:hypothetical protein n=1 Tax=[Flexibacter] sp. ATCC 35208 TaxID=1936242 RepID=UPI0015C35801|nr:hypothetical protein [[Flexibacter] sp. ATCC 35208]
MRFDKVSPTAALAPYIKYNVIAENTQAEQYTVFSSTRLGFRTGDLWFRSKVSWIFV